MMAENQVMEPTDQESHLGESIATAAAESAQPPLATAKLTPAVSETAKPTQWSAKPSREVAIALPEVESARPAQEAAKLTLLPLEVPETAKPSQDTTKPSGAPLVAQEKDVEPSSDDKVVFHQLQVEDISVDDNVTIILEDTRGQVKSLRLEQKSIDSIEPGESAENPSLEHVCQDEKKVVEVRVMANKGLEGRSLASKNF
jgi:hypothetical protein